MAVFSTQNIINPPNEIQLFHFIAHICRSNFLGSFNARLEK